MEVLYEFTGALCHALGLLGLVLMLGAGLWALLAPHSFLRLNRWDTHKDRRAAAWDKPHFIDRFIYRHHRSMGLLLMVSAASLLFVVIFLLQPVTVVAHSGYALWWPLLPEVVMGLFYLVSIIALCIGTVVLVRPSALRSLEAWSNRWISMRRPLKHMSKSLDSPDIWMYAHPRVFGALLLLICFGLLLTVNFFIVD